MAMGCFPERDLERFLQGVLSGEETREVVRHLLSECGACSRSLASVATRLNRNLEDLFSAPAPAGFPAAPIAGQPGVGDREGSVVRMHPACYRDIPFEPLEAEARAIAEERAEEKAKALGLWIEIQGLPLREQLRRVRVDNRLQTVGFFERMLAISRDLSRSPQEAVAIARLVVYVGRRLTGLAEALLSDLLVASLGNLGNAKRRAGDFRGAREALDAAWALLEDGSGDVLEDAKLWVLQGSFHLDLRQFDEADRCFSKAIAIYVEVHDDHMVGRTLLQKADAIGQLDPRAGISMVHEALHLIDGEREPRLLQTGKHNLITYLNEAGQSREAMRLLEEARPLYAEFDDTFTQVRYHWLEGRILRGLGNLGVAEKIFKALWQEFRRLDLRFELTMLSIDLIEVYVESRKDFEAVALISEVYPLLKEWGMHDEGLGTWLLLRPVVEGRGNRPTEFAKVRRYYHTAWLKPLPG